MTTDSDFSNELLQRVKAAAGKPVVETSAQHRAGLTDADVQRLKGNNLNPAARAFVEQMCKSTARGLTEAFAESFGKHRDVIEMVAREAAAGLQKQEARIAQLEQQIALMQNALAQSGQKFVLPADEHQPLTFTRRA